MTSCVPSDCTETPLFLFAKKHPPLPVYDGKGGCFFIYIPVFSRALPRFHFYTFATNFLFFVFPLSFFMPTLPLCFLPAEPSFPFLVFYPGLLPLAFFSCFSVTKSGRPHLPDLSYLYSLKVLEGPGRFAFFFLASFRAFLPFVPFLAFPRRSSA